MLDLDLSSRTVFELHLEIQSLKRAVAVLKERVRQVEKKQRRPEEPPPHTRGLVRSMMAVVCGCAQTTAEAIISDRRDAPTVRARQTVCWLARRYTHRTYSEIARPLRRDHTTVLHAVYRVDGVVAALGRCPVEDTPQAWAEMLLAEPWPKMPI